MRHLIVFLLSLGAICAMPCWPTPTAFAAAWEGSENPSSKPAAPHRGLDKGFLALGEADLDPGPGPLDPAVPSPVDVLGYPLGSNFTRYHQVRDYLHRLSEASERVQWLQYGETYEGRPLHLAVISSPSNLARLEEIRRGLQQLANPTDGGLGSLGGSEQRRLTAKLPAVVWLAYGVHGNESSSTEVAMATAYVLAASQGPLARDLEELVVIIDPLVNPDGRERYVQSFTERRGRTPDLWRDSMEHREPWPGGRFNHYLFDLNRDWAWATQQETRHRLEAYRQWEPQVYVDFHEMGSDSSYFFPPPADPILSHIDRRTLGWLETFGRANAAAFDQAGWLYYKAEVFDLFYPGYGDSYPALRGAVGMTYEVAGGGRGGLAVDRPGGPLTLADRVARHFTTSLTTVRTAAANRQRLLEDFAATRAQSLMDPARTYLWRGVGGESRALAQLLELHGVEVQRLGRTVELEAQRVADDSSRRLQLPAGSYAVSSAQPLGSLVHALLSREAEMPASFLARQRQNLEARRSTDFADITAWSLPLAFGVEVWSLDGELSAQELSSTGAISASPEVAPHTAGITGGSAGSQSVALLIPPQGLAGYRLAAQLQARQMYHRLALGTFATARQRYPAGTLVIPTGGTGNAAGDSRELERDLDEMARALGVEIHRAVSGYTVEGLSLGSDEIAPVLPSRIGLLGGSGTIPTSHGAIWHLLDRTLEIPFTRLQLDLLEHTDLSGLDVLLLPDGYPESALGEGGKERLSQWVRAGGVLVAIGQASSLMRDLELSAIEPWTPGNGDAGGSHGDEPLEPELLDSGELEEDSQETTPFTFEPAPETSLASLPLNTPGAVIATRLHSEHPLASGLPASPPVLVQGSTVLQPTGDRSLDVLVAAPADPVLAGFAWPEAEDRLAGSLLMAAEPAGRGLAVTFTYDPAFRELWRATMPLLLNAALYGPTVLDALSPRY